MKEEVRVKKRKLERGLVTKAKRSTASCERSELWIKQKLGCSIITPHVALKDSL